MLDKISCTYLFQITHNMANYNEQNGLIKIFCRYCDVYVFKYCIQCVYFSNFTTC